MNRLERLASATTDKQLADIKAELVPPKEKESFSISGLYYPFCNHTLSMFDNFYISPTGDLVNANDLPQGFSTIRMERYNLPLASEESHIDFLEPFYIKQQGGTLTAKDVLECWVHLGELKAEDVPKLSAKGMKSEDIEKIDFALKQA